jgi:thymidylate synthase
MTVSSATIPEFDTLDEMWLDTVDTIIERGHEIPSRDGPTRELLGYSARLLDPRAHFLFNPVRKAAPWYAAAELLWYLSGSSEIEMMVHYAPQYERFCDGPDDVQGKAHGAYGKRLLHPELESMYADRYEQLLPELYWKRFGPHSDEIGPYGCTQLDALLWLLSEKQDTRQAVVTFHRPTDLGHAILGGKNDIPCTICLIFMVRDGKLYLRATIRSNDVWLGVPYDVFCFCGLQMLVASALKLELGWYQHDAMSMHLYDRNYIRARQAIDPGSFSTGNLDYRGVGRGRVNEAIVEALKLERWNREQGVCANAVDTFQWSLLGQMVVFASFKTWRQKSNLARVGTPLMKKYIQRNWYD